jgi:tetratricopeptide (TPR) repeat protein
MQGVLLQAALMVWAATPPWEANFFRAPPQEVLAAAAAVAVPARTGVDVLWRDVAYTFDLKGRQTTTSRLVYRLHTRNAVEGWGSVEVRHSPWYEEKPEVRVRVITADGTAHLLDKKTLSESSVEKDQKNPLEFHDERITRGPLPAVAPGCVVEEEVVVRDKRPLFEQGTVHSVKLGHPAPTQATRITVSAPVTLPLQYRLLGTALPIEDETKGKLRVLTVALGPQKRAPRVPVFLPSDVPRAPALAFSTGKDWQAVARGYHAQVEKKIMPAAVAKVARELAGDVKDPRVLVQRFMGHVRKTLRYAAVEFGEGSIIPRTPVEVFKRRYGDCKDLSTLLVSMLRAVDVPAHLALLRAGPGADVHAELPGLGMFNHAIVMVPTETPLWVDPTELYGSPLELPFSDQERLALVIAPQTTQLTRTNKPPYTVHTYTEKRDVTLAVEGPATVLETTQATGNLGSYIRSSHADRAPDQRQDMFKRYVKDVYKGELDGLEFGALESPDEPLELRLKVTKANTIWTDDREAIVVLTAYPAVEHLPRELLPDDREEEEEDADVDDKPPPRTDDHVLNIGYVGSLQYVIHRPEGMVLEKLPERHEKVVADARLTREASQDPNGDVTVTMRLDTGKGRYTPAEFKQLKAAVADFLKVSRAQLTWRHKSRWLVAQGKGKEGYQEHARMVALFPSQAVYRERLAKDLLAQGFGVAAREEVARAVAVEPQRADAHFSQAWILMNDTLGRYARAGFDRPGAVAALRRGLELRKDDVWARAALAEMLTYDDKARRYGPELDPTEAIALLESIRTELKDHSRDGRLMGVLMRTGRYAQLEAVAQEAPPGAERNAYLAAAVAAQRGASEVDGALRRSVKAQKDRNAALVGAADELVHRAQYALAAALLRQAAEQSDAPAQLLTRARFLDTVKPWVRPTTPTSDPGEAVLRYALSFMSPEVPDDELANMVARAPECGLLPEDRRTLDEVSRAQGGLPAAVLRDITAVAVTMAHEGDPSVGWRVRMVSKIPNAPAGQDTFAVMEDGVPKVLNIPTGSVACLGTQALKALDAGRPKAAQQWLNWARAGVRVPAGDDPLRMPPLATLWTEGQPADPATMRVAAAALVATGPKAATAVPILNAALQGRLAGPQVAAVRLALLDAAGDDLKLADVQTLALLKQYPSSAMAMELRLSSLLEAKRFPEAEAQWQSRLKASPKDPNVLMQLARLAQAQGQYTRSEQYYARLEAAGGAGTGALNNWAWLALFSGSNLDDAINRAQRAVGNDGPSRAELNTLAALYAEAGRVREALEILRKLYPPESHQAPDSSDLAVWGRLAEQEGLHDVARKLYANLKVTPKVHPISVEAWVARRLAAMPAASQAP